MLGEFLLNSVRVCAGLIDLIDGNDNGNACCLGVGDGLYCLGHYTVICSYNENCDISYMSTSCTHGCEGFVTRGIQEYDLLAVDVYFGSTDVLGDSACFSESNVGLADCVQ